ncbi:hypothetical protein XO09_04245 [Thermosipho sp. 1223]|nr:hypothetical protein XO09_04245 [Thermosipho sp. 1223]
MIPNFVKSLMYNLINKVRYSRKHVKIHILAKTNLNSKFEGYSKIYKNVIVYNSYIGLGTYIAPNSNLSNCKIGRFCSIASKVEIVSGRHPSKGFVSTHPAFYSLAKQAGFTFAEEQLFDEFKYVDKEKKYLVKIGNDVWIGYGVKIMEGVKIGDGAIIGAGALVTKDIEPYSINVGIPARKIDYRFSEEDIKMLLKIRWWDKDINFLKRHYRIFSDIKRFCKFMGEGI